MTESNARRVFGAVEITAPDTNKDWRAVPRSEMFGAVIVAVDGAKSEAEDLGDTHFVQYVDSVLFPFLEAEFEAARATEEPSYRDVLEELAASRGFVDAEEVARRAVEPSSWTPATRSRSCWRSRLVTSALR